MQFFSHSIRPVSLQTVSRLVRNPRNWGLAMFVCAASSGCVTTEPMFDPQGRCSGGLLGSEGERVASLGTPSRALEGADCPRAGK